MSDGTDGSASLRRRALLRAVAGAGTASLAGCPTPSPDAGDATATPAGDDEARRLAERFAPTTYFDANERWFPTDPRPYASERDGETVVDGFDALDGYAGRFDGAESPPDPTVFYHVVRYGDSPLAAVEFWYYSVFDQFATNFHWHDWETLSVFVDAETGDPQLLVGSAHARAVPNNEFLDPDPDQRPRVLTELGSHSSAISENARPDHFLRLPTGDLTADITNHPLDVVKALSDLPAAYGLPRDEGARLPYAVPELDGRPLYEHERLPAVDRSMFVPPALTVRSFDDLSEPPTDLPDRQTGVVFAHDDPDADVSYDLVSTAELEHVADFVGQQLSFEFAVPKFAEDAVANHLTTTDPPWTQERYDDPAADVTDPAHRAALADRYDAIAPPGPFNAVVASVTRTVPDDDAPEGEGVQTVDAPVETLALVESDSVVAPTFRGVAMAHGLPAGEHRLTVNGAGFAPHSESVSVPEGETTAAGVDGEVPLVAAGEALKLRVDADGTDARLTNLAVEDDFGGRLYDAPMDGPAAVYVHRGGAYTTEVRDDGGALGAFRVNPSDRSAVTVAHPHTGKASLAGFVSTLATETSEQVGTALAGSKRSLPGGVANAVTGLVTALDAVSSAADRAAERSAAGDRAGADHALEAVGANLDRVATRLDSATEGLPDPVANAVERRLRQARTRTSQALDTEIRSR
ncbi:MAG: hypothetical protein ABEJ82_06660 [Haloplanus sp.]